MLRFRSPLLSLLSLLLLAQAIAAAGDLCNRTDGIVPCPYGGLCTLKNNGLNATCKRNCIDWGNGVTSTGLCDYNATTWDGVMQPNPMLCEHRTDIYNVNCTSGFACQRQWTKAPPVCSPTFKACAAQTPCAGVGEVCVANPRANIGDAAKVCVDGSLRCTGAKGDECPFASVCVAHPSCGAAAAPSADCPGVCVNMLLCNPRVLGCP